MFVSAMNLLQVEEETDWN